MPENESPLVGIEPTEKGLRSLARIKERFKIDELPEGLNLAAASEAGIADVYMNLNRLLADGKLEEKTKVLIALGAASTLGNNAAADFFAKIAFAAGRTQQEILDAISVAAVCGVFNGYYRFRHQVPADLKTTFETFRAPFNGNSFMKSSLSQKEVEAICVGVSSLNNCEICVEGHINKAKSLGIDDEQIDEIVKTIAVTAAVSGMIGALSFARADATKT